MKDSTERKVQNNFLSERIHTMQFSNKIGNSNSPSRISGLANARIYSA